ncbi:MAG TPA: hypothetical protein VGQ20_10160 [Acidimicrobiales bacterium]|nr:hypothetical protein [Acidimicrobiales bacterium]
MSCVVVLALVAVGAIGVITRGDSRYPEQWDPRIQPLASFVERARGLSFEHPVYVDFSEREDFVAKAGEGYEMSDEERKEVEQWTGQLRAFGLVRGEVDLFGSSKKLNTDGVAAYYSFDTKRITVNGTDLDENTRVTVVHELTHALQDQHFDLTKLQRDHEEDVEDTLTAMFEGDAVRIQSMYFASLSDAEQERAMTNMDSDIDEADLGDVPLVLSSLFGSPYTLGEPFVTLLAELKGDRGVNEAMLNPPASTEQLLDPFRYLHADMPETVSEPELQKGEEKFDSGVLGAMFWYLVFSQRVGPKDALAAADGWGGDSYVAFERDGKVCVRAALRADTPADHSELIGALSSWASAMPAGAVRFSTTEQIDVESCDPGASASIPPPMNPDIDPLVVPATRAFVALSLAADGASEKEAQCASTQIMKALSLEQITAPNEQHAPQIESIVRTARQSCASVAGK